MGKQGIQRRVIVIPKSIHKDRITSNFDMFNFDMFNFDMFNFELFTEDIVNCHQLN